jgi:hypothetical protein
MSVRILVATTYTCCRKLVNVVSQRDRWIRRMVPSSRRSGTFDQRHFVNGMDRSRELFVSAIFRADKLPEKRTNPERFGFFARCLTCFNCVIFSSTCIFSDNPYLRIELEMEYVSNLVVSLHLHCSPLYAFLLSAAHWHFAPTGGCLCKKQMDLFGQKSKLFERKGTSVSRQLESGEYSFFFYIVEMCVISLTRKSLLFIFGWTAMIQIRFCPIGNSSSSLIFRGRRSLWVQQIGRSTFAPILLKILDWGMETV